MRPIASLLAGVCAMTLFAAGARAVGCNDGVDDDGDGFVDLQDPGCRDAADLLEVHLRPGDVLAAQANGGVSVFDPQTLRMAPLATAGDVTSAWEATVSVDGDVLVTDPVDSELIELDAEFGGGTTLTSLGLVETTHGIAPAAAGSVFASGATHDVIAEVDLSTGVQTLVTGDPGFASPQALLVDPSDGSLLSSDTAGIFRISDPFGSPSVSEVPTSLITTPRQILFDSATTLLVADEGLNRPVRLDLGTSAETSLLSFGPFTTLRGLLLEPSGLVLGSDHHDGRIFRMSEAADTATEIEPGTAGSLRHLTPVPTPAELELALTDLLLVDGGALGVVDAGDTLELTAVVTNVGATLADLLSLESGLDPNLTLVGSSLTTSQGSIVEGSSSSDPRIEVSLGSLAASASATVSWEVVVSDPSPATHVGSNAWIRRDRLILAESDDPTTGPIGDSNVVEVGDLDVTIHAFQKLSDVRGGFSGPGDPGSILANSSKLSVAEPIGDFDQDAVPDVALSTWSTDAGDLYLAALTPEGRVKQRVDVARPAGVTDTDRYGRCTAYLGDLDRSGPSAFALAVTADLDDGNGTARGAVHIVFLASDGSLQSSVEIGDGGSGGFPNGEIGNLDNFGGCVESLGNLDGPGGSAAAIAVGHYADDEAGANAGAVWIIFLKTDGTVHGSPVKITEGLGGFDGLVKEPGATGRDHFGYALAALGDLNGDGNPELAIGERGDDEGGSVDAGAFWIVSIGSNGQALAGAVKYERSHAALAPLLGPADTLFGQGLARIDDLDGDGAPELLVGYGSGASQRYLLTYLGSDKSLKAAADWSDALGAFPELETASWRPAAQIGDLDGDGRPEIAMGPNEDGLDDEGGTDRGAVYVLFPDADPSPAEAPLLGAWGAAALAASLLACGARAAGRRAR